jgi:hypothetical protein
MLWLKERLEALRLKVPIIGEHFVDSEPVHHGERHVIDNAGLADAATPSTLAPSLLARETQAFPWIPSARAVARQIADRDVEPPRSRIPTGQTTLWLADRRI